MTSDQYLIVMVTTDGKSYVSWPVDTNGQQLFAADGRPIEPLNATRTTVKATLGTNVQNEMPTLST